MRVLIVCGYFPPYSIIGAQRVQAFAKFLVARGHDVHVLTAGGYDLPRHAQSPIDKGAITEVKFTDVNWPIKFAVRILGRISGAQKQDGYARANAPNEKSLAYRLAQAWRSLTNIPDSHVGWLFPAIRAGKKLIRKGWQPDVIFASALPFSAALVAQRLAHFAGCPWAVEFRDLWHANPYLPTPYWRNFFNRKIEAAILRNAGCIITISEPLAQELRKCYKNPVEVVTNGFDETEFPADGGLGEHSRHKLTLYHAGTIYTGKRNPLPLFQALVLLGEQRHRIEITFSGQDLRGVKQAAQKAGVESCVHIEGFLPRAETINKLLATDIALLLLWDDPREAGVYSGKLFEYLGAQRPILMLGYENGVAADLIRRLEAGYILNDPRKIAERLSVWLDQKEKTGLLPPCNHPERKEYSTDRQFSKQLQILSSLLDVPAPSEITCVE